jgi:hypothetical protein
MDAVSIVDSVHDVLFWGHPESAVAAAAKPALVIKQEIKTISIIRQDLTFFKFFSLNRVGSVIKDGCGSKAG